MALRFHSLVALFQCPIDLPFGVALGDGLPFVVELFALGQGQLAVFAALGFVLCFGAFPAHPSLAERRWARATDIVLALLSAACCLYVVVQTEAVLHSADVEWDPPLTMAIDPANVRPAEGSVG